MTAILLIQVCSILISALAGFWLAWLIQARRVGQARYDQQCARQVAIRAGCEAREKEERFAALERTQMEILRAIRETNKALCISEPPKPSTFFTYSDLEVVK